MSWEAQSARFVLYTPPASVLPDANDIWNNLLAPRMAENVQRPQGMGIPQSIASGTVRDNQFSITVQPGRLDLVMGSNAGGWFNQRGAPTEWKQLLDSLIFYGRKCITSYPVMRLAMVMDVVQPATDFPDAHQKMLRELPFLPILDGTRDINFQVNPTCMVGDTGKTMFRLCRWGTALVQLFNVQAGMSFSPSPNAFIEQRHVFAFQTDLSSEPTGTEALDSLVVGAIFDKLGYETGQLLTHGYGHFTQ